MRLSLFFLAYSTMSNTQENEIGGSPLDRTKRPRLENDDVDSDDENLGPEDRHPKRQAVPDPETKAPHFAGQDSNNSSNANDNNKERYRRKKWEEFSEDEDDVKVLVDETDHKSQDENNKPAASISAEAAPVHYTQDATSVGSPSSGPSISLRSLVSTKDAGVIIGRGGKNVSEIREYSAARVTISDIVQGAIERILTVSGPVNAVSKVNDMAC